MGQKITKGEILADLHYAVIQNGPTGPRYFARFHEENGFKIAVWGHPEEGRIFRLMGEARAVCDVVGGTVYDAAGIVPLCYTSH